MLAGVGRLVAPYDELTVQVIKICELPPRPEDERRSFLLIVPFITDSIRTMVEQEKVSCIDLSGNYLIQSTELLAIRLDRKNRVFRAYSFQSGSLPQYEVTRFFSDDRAELENDRFYNVVLEGRTEPFIFFDRQTARNKVCWASRLQTYLELSNLDKREREIAESIREGILKEFK